MCEKRLRAQHHSSQKKMLQMMLVKMLGNRSAIKMGRKSLMEKKAVPALMFWTQLRVKVMKSKTIILQRIHLV
ncbi:hypothetical protein HK17_15305 [Acetobacter indonesiensis]|uniref:Uncharacterized protein n=1 Tax=Acetobacter indonesiensis TaxID=104101 RepID=A0A252AJU3_9PROT|nr:hypothetical protein HK17_15305 [Acetobacter indonesiensis]